jgi:hypothetical protein
MSSPIVGLTCVWYGVAFLWRPGGPLLLTRDSVAVFMRGLFQERTPLEVRFLRSTPFCDDDHAA